MVVLQQRNTQTCAVVDNSVFVMWGLQNNSPGRPGPAVDTLRQREVRMEQTNTRGSSVSLENMKISKKIHRKSKFISSRGEDTEVTLLQK